MLNKQTLLVIQPQQHIQCNPTSGVWGGEGRMYLPLPCEVKRLFRIVPQLKERHIEKEMTEVKKSWKNTKKT